MRKTFLVMRSEIGRSLQRKTFVFFAFGFPLILGAIALVFMLANRGATPAAPPPAPASTAQVSREGYVDQGGLIKTLPADIPAGRLTAYPSEAAAQAALAAGEIAGYYLIAPDYVPTGKLTYVRPEYNPLGGSVSTDSMEWALLVNVLGGDSKLAASVWRPLDVRVTPLVLAEQGASQQSVFTELFPTLMVLLIYMVILLPAGVLVNAVTDEKKNRIMEVLMTSVSPGQMITGKILGMALLGLLETALWLGIMWAVVRFGAQPLRIPPGFAVPTSLIIWTFVYFLGGYAIYGAQLAGVGALAPDLNETRSGSLIVMAPLIVTYMFMIVVFTNPNTPLALFVSLFPLTSPIGMIARLAVTEVPLWQAVLAAILQFLTAIVIVRLTAHLFRAQHLLSGQPFSVGRYYRTLLGQA